MTKPATNRFISELFSFCNANVLVEKWLIAPSFRIGYQWLDTATRFGHSMLNVRVKTMRSLAMDLAAPRLADEGLSPIGPIEGQILMGNLLSQIRETDSGYLSQIELSDGLALALLGCLEDLRMADLSPADLPKEAFEVATKGQELGDLLKRYTDSLKQRNQVDTADLYSLAIAGVSGKKSILQSNLKLLFPSNTLERLAGLEKKLWEHIPSDLSVSFPVDQPNTAPPEGQLTNLGALRWVQKPTEAPAAKRTDTTAEIFAAVGHANEVREVIRRCISNGAGLDQCEVICTDVGTYTPLFYEILSGLSDDGLSEPPVTFAAGIPTRYSRPARLIRAWVEWIRQGFPQTTAVKMLQEGLLNLQVAPESSLSPNRAGEILREVPIGSDAVNYITQVNRYRNTLQTRAKELRDNNEPADIKEADRLENKIVYLNSIEQTLEHLLPDFDPSQAAPRTILEKTISILETNGHYLSNFDLDARDALLGEIIQLKDAISEGCPVSFRPWQHLDDITQSMNIYRQGPRPGCLHVTSMSQGGHSGRNHTYVVGLDDSRFPGTILQDPLLLDKERKALSDELMHSETKMGRKVEDFLFLLSRLRGHCTLSFCCRSLDDDRAVFPSPLVTSAYRILSKEMDGDQEGLFKWLAPPVSFAPTSVDRSMGDNDWWLSKSFGENHFDKPLEITAKFFPHLGRGQKAADARDSNKLTEYDGFVPQAGKDHSPYRSNAEPMSASRLEKFGKCPLDYFFQYILGVSHPEETGVDRDTWLDALARGTLLHEVFRAFMVDLHSENTKPSYPKHLKRINKALQTEVSAWREAQPPPSEEVFAREMVELEKTVEVFLKEEAKFCRDRTPAYFEVGLGLPVEGEACLLDTTDPVSIVLPGGKSIFVHGRIDRIDQTGTSKKPTLSVWDYKTGSAKYYNRHTNIFNQGRTLQSIIYSLMVEQRLSQTDLKAKVDSFGYFFPGVKEMGERIEWPISELEGGRQILKSLCDLMASGSFPESNKDKDLWYSDYQDLREDVDDAIEQVKVKIANPDNKSLKPYVSLRGEKKGRSQ